MAISQYVQKVTPYIKSGGSYEKLVLPASSIVMANGSDLETELQGNSGDGSSGSGGSQYNILASGTLYSQGTIIKLNQPFTNFNEIYVEAGYDYSGAGVYYHKYITSLSAGYQVIPFYQKRTFMGTLTLKYDKSNPQEIQIESSNMTVINNIYGKITKIFGVKYL